MEAEEFGLLVAQAVEKAIHWDIANGDGYSLAEVVNKVCAKCGVLSKHIDAPGLSVAAIGVKHFGNPIPREWYAAARELIDLSKEPK